MFRIIRNRNAHGSDGSHRARLTPSELQKNCEKLAAEKFNREPANDEDRFDYGGHYNARLKKRFYRETYISHTPVGTDLQDKCDYYKLLDTIPAETKVCCQCHHQCG